MAVLNVSGLSKIYGNGENRVKALDNVNFTVEEGELVAIVGKSGSGKSTLLHILAGIDTATSGSVVVNNKEILNLGHEELAKYRRKETCIIYQFYNLVPVLNVEENITFPSLLNNEKVDYNKLNNLLEAIGMSERRKHYPNQLSGGQQQRVAVGRALYVNPSIILADEPTGNLDSKTGAAIMEVMLRVNKELGKTILIVTHDMQIAQMADRIITISDGKIEKDINNTYVN